jgi:hypothetical protein
MSIDIFKIYFKNLFDDHYPLPLPRLEIFKVSITGINHRAG